MAYAGRKCQIKLGGAPVALSNAATTADGARKVYQITDAAKRVLDPNVVLTIEKSTDGTTWSAASGFTVDRLTGKVNFSVAQAVGTQIRVSGSYLPMTAIGEAFEFTYTLEGDNQDVSSFSNDYIKRIQGIKDATASLSRWYVDNTFYDRLMAGSLCMLEFWINGTTPDLKMWAILASDELSGSVDGVIEESLEFEGSADADGRVVSY